MSSDLLPSPVELFVTVVEAFQPNFLLENMKTKNHPRQCVLQLPLDQFNYIKQWATDAKLFKKAPNSIIVDYKSLGALPSPGATGILRIFDHPRGGQVYRNFSFIPEERLGANPASSDPAQEPKSETSAAAIQPSPSKDVRQLFGISEDSKQVTLASKEQTPMTESTAKSLVSEMQDMRLEMRELKVALMELTVTLKALRK